MMGYVSFFSCKNKTVFLQNEGYYCEKQSSIYIKTSQTRSITRK